MTDSSATAPPSLSVLLAEDEPLVQRTLSRLLERRGHRVHVAGSAEVALDVVRRVHIDAAVVDVNMPGSGLSVLRALACDAAFQGPLVLMTGDLPEDHESAVDGSVSLLAKPFSIGRLIDLVEGGRPGLPGMEEAS